MDKVDSTKQTTKASKPKVSLKNRIDNAKKVVRSRFDNITKKLGIHRKKAKKATREQKKLARQQRIHGIIGIGLLFVVVSIAYSTYMTNLFVDGTQMVVALAPQVAFALIVSIYAFYKIYK